MRRWLLRRRPKLALAIFWAAHVKLYQSLNISDVNDAEELRQMYERSHVEHVYEQVVTQRAAKQPRRSSTDVATSSISAVAAESRATNQAVLNQLFST